MVKSISIMEGYAYDVKDVMSLTDFTPKSLHLKEWKNLKKNKCRIHFIQ